MENTQADMHYLVTVTTLTVDRKVAEPSRVHLRRAEELHQRLDQLHLSQGRRRDVGRRLNAQGLVQDLRERLGTFDDEAGLRRSLRRHRRRRGRCRGCRLPG